MGADAEATAYSGLSIRRPHSATSTSASKRIAFFVFG
jgi:hypothetical protein